MAKTIIIVTNSEDAHADQIQKRLRERCIMAHRLDSDRLVADVNVWQISSDPAQPTTNSWFVPDVDVVWYRKVYFPEGNDPIESFVRQELDGLLEGILLHYRQARWINPRDRLAIARSKIGQLEQAKKLGFRIPDTLLTTSVDKLAVFTIFMTVQLLLSRFKPR